MASTSVGKQQAKPSGKKNAGRKPKTVGTPLHDWFIAIFGVAFILSFALNVLIVTNGDVDTGDVGGKGHSSNARASRVALRKAMKDFRDHQSVEKKNLIRKVNDPNTKTANHDDSSSLMELATLDCKAYGGPSKEAVQEMVYWQDIPSDSAYAPPFFEINNREEKRKYLTFEPDGGGWNNIRMAMESTFAMAVAMGRTLVMPPQKKMYLLGAGQGGQQHHFSFVDFFPVAEMAEDNRAFNVISMQEYLEEEGMKGNLVNKVCRSLNLTNYCLFLCLFLCLFRTIVLCVVNCRFWYGPHEIHPSVFGKPKRRITLLFVSSQVFVSLIFSIVTFCAT